jgi:hypothetical protein
MNKEEEEEDKDCLDHDIVRYEDYDTFMASLNHRYIQGDLKVTRPYIWHGHMDDPTFYKMDEDHEWVVCKQPPVPWTDYNTNKAIVLKIFTDIGYMPPFINEDADYIIPRINTALLARGRTAKLRVKRVKPACIRREEKE